MNRFININYAPLAVLALFALGIAPAVDAAVDAKVKITHKAEKKVPSGERIPLSVGIKDKDHAIELVRTYFKAKEGSKCYFVAMRPANGTTYAGMLPAREMFDGVCLLFAGALLLTPGFVTDTIGILLFVPAVRAYLRSLFTRHLSASVETRGFGHGAEMGGQGPIIDGDYDDASETEPDSQPQPRNRIPPR